MASQSSIDYDNFIEIKQEVESIYKPPVIIQNNVFSEQHTFKSEPEENFCMEIDSQTNEHFVDTGVIHNAATNSNENFLKISSVTQGFNVDDLTSKTVGKRGRKPKNVEALKVATKMKPAKNTKTLQKAVKHATSLDQNLNNIQKTRQRKATLKKSVKGQDSEQEIQIFGENKGALKLTLDKNSKAKPQKPSKSVQTATISQKIIQIYGSNDEESRKFDNSKIPIQKSQTLPSKSTKSAQQCLKNQQKSIKSETPTQSLQSSFIVDKNSTSQLKLKISRSQKSLDSTVKLKKTRQCKKQPRNDSKGPNIFKQESNTKSIIKPEPEVPLHILPDDYDLKLIDYEPKITKKRKVIRLDCDHCGKVFKSKYSIIWHMKEHMLTMPFNCKVCGKGFSYERSFKQHELTHAAKVKCEICSKSLKPHAMYYHMKYRHTSEKTHQCPVCPKAFKTKDNIARHMMRHNMEFPCTICGRKFAENSRLQMHLNMHENPEQFFCSICNKSFEHIDRHMKRLHAQKRERNLKCRYCEYASDSKQTLRRHEEMHEKRNEILQSKTKKRKIKLKIIEMKTFECKVCNVVLQTKSGYKSHLRHYHKGKDQVKAVLVNEIKDESSMESDNFEEIKVEKEEISLVQ
ncbi:hypothetical protein ACKWTF_016456 [Chironomus riparius]